MAVDERLLQGTVEENSDPDQLHVELLLLGMIQSLIEESGLHKDSSMGRG